MDHSEHSSHGSGSIWFAVSENIGFSTVICGIFAAITVPTFAVTLLRTFHAVAGRIYAPWAKFKPMPRLRLLTLLSFLAGADAVNIWFLVSFVPLGMCLTLTVAHRNSLIIVTNPTWRTRFMIAVYFVCAAVFIFQEAIGIWNLAYLIEKDDPQLWSSVSLLPGYAVVPMCAYPIIIVTGSHMSLRIAFNDSLISSPSSKLTSSPSSSRSVINDPSSTISTGLLVPAKDEANTSASSLAAPLSATSLALPHSTSSLNAQLSASSLPLKGSTSSRRSFGLQVPVTSTFKVLTVVFILDWILMLFMLLWPTVIPIQPGTMLTALLAEISFESMLKRRRIRQARKENMDSMRPDDV
ncbi:hypothetical protein H9P43_006618 [Blastocladiella emersonii ATCC 22665]|nr:hypothetical protein H9P43_006618 [Blastocladiella emersonii ATCC 22665]